MCIYYFIYYSSQPHEVRDIIDSFQMADALGRLRMMVWGGRREEGSGWGTRVYLWQIHVDIQQNQYNIVKLKKKKRIQKKNQGQEESATYLQFHS